MVDVFAVLFHRPFRRFVIFPLMFTSKTLPLTSVHFRLQTRPPPILSIPFRLRRCQFQKRGLPHAHILIIVDADDKPQPEHYDRYVSAELPDPDHQPHQFQRVASSVVH